MRSLGTGQQRLRHRAAHWCALAAAAAMLAAAGTARPAVPDVLERIRAAGQTDNEAERLQILRELDRRPDLDESLRSDLRRLLPVVEDWANGRARATNDASRAAENGYLCQFISSRVRPAGDGPVHPPEVPAASPLRPIWAFYRGRMLLWRVVQSGPLLRVKATRERYYTEARRLIEETRAAFPQNRIARMYLGEPIPWPARAPDDPCAPAWANLQREGLEKLADIIHWWIAERQLPDGQFGGGWGDDVEMWRWWTPILIAFEDPAVNAAQELLSTGMFRQPHMRQGFTARLTDVEHSNEDTTDTILPMMHLKPHDPVWQTRALRLVELARDRWTGRNDAGFLQFRSIYFSADKVDGSAHRALDTVYHPAIIQPALLFWQRTGDTNVAAFVGEWLKLWIDATARAGNGKPAGVMPSAIRWPDGAIGKPGQPWWQPFDEGHNDALYNWPGAARLMTSTLLLAHRMTRDETYLAPIRSMAGIWRRHRSSPNGDMGAEAWCAEPIRGFLADTLAKYRQISGDRSYDDLLTSDAAGYARYRLSGDLAPLESALRRTAEAFRWNREGYTSEMRWTDRVLSFTRNYLEHLPVSAPPTPSVETLYGSASGDPGNPLIFPMNAVRWRTPPRDIAALVVDSGPETLAAHLFHFGTDARPMAAEFHLLVPGEYELTMADAGADGGTPWHRASVRVAGPRAEAAFSLPPRRLCLLRVVRRPDAPR